MTGGLLALHSRTFASLRRHRNYRLFLTGQAISVCGSAMQEAALPWLVYELTHSPTHVGLLLFCRNGPFLLFSLSAGLMADRFDNRRFVFLSQSAGLLVAAALAIFAFTDAKAIWLLYVLAFLGGTAFVFDVPSRQALTYQMVGREDLQNAVALNLGITNTSWVVGPAIGGVLIAAFGASVCFTVNAASFLCVLTAILLMRPAELFPLDRAETRPKGLTAIREGISYVRGDALLRMVVAIAAVMGFVGFNFRVLLPVLTSQTLGAGADAFGFLFACFGAGALLGTLFAAGSGRPSFARVFAGVSLLGAAMLALAPVHALWLAAVLLVVGGAGFSLWTVNNQSILQLSAPDRLRGRVLGLYVFVFAGATALGSVFAGWLADIGGTELAFALSGAVGLCVAATVFANRHLMDSYDGVAPTKRSADTAGAPELEPLL